MDESRIDIPSMRKRGKAILDNRPGSSQPPERANYQVAIPAESNNVPRMFPLGHFHNLSDGSENIESKLLALDRQNFEELVENMMVDTRKIWDWCVGVDRRHSDEDLGRMMARSGLLLLEFLRFLADLPRSKEFFQPKERQLSVAVIKIENQIPFFVLKRILKWERDADKDLGSDGDADGDADKDENRQADTDLHSILKDAWLKLSPILYDDSPVIAEVQLKDDSHLLEFLYENIIGSSDFKQAYNGREIKRGVRHISLLRAEQLQGVGVKFAPNEGLLNKICFNSTNRTLYLPTIKMYCGTVAVWKNLVVFEASKQGKESQPLMSYVNLMNRLIDTANDVQALRNGGIIHLGCNAKVADFWRKMSRPLPNKKIKYEPIDNAIYEVTRSYTSPVESCRIMYTGFKESYCSNPWTVLSVISACILFALAGLQSYLAWEQLRLQRESMPKT